MVAAAVVAAVAPTVFAPPAVAHADMTTVSSDVARDGWVSNETTLTPSSIGKLQLTFDHALSSGSSTEQTYAEPLVVGSQVIVATETDRVYSLDRNTGAETWARSLGTAEPSSQIGCSDLTPNVGITSTPVYDPSTSSIYVVARTWDGSTAAWKLHKLVLATGADAPGWPVTLDGNLVASNDPNLNFDPVQEASRPGLLLMGGRVFAGFASYCDQTPYVGWIASVSTSSTPSVHMWTDEPALTNAAFSADNGPRGGGLWMSGAGLMSDGAGRIFFSTGNGFPVGSSSSIPPAGAGLAVTPTTPLAEAVVRVAVQPDGSVAAADFFAPHDAQSLSDSDQDLASSGVTALPTGFGGVAGHPNLLVVGGKNGVDYLLDRDNLGGESATSSDTGAVGETFPASASPVFGHAAVWPGDGGYIYFPGDNLGCPSYSCGVDAYQVRIVSGVTKLVLAGTGSSAVGFGTGSPVVTSSSTTSGSALVWQVVLPGSSGSTELRTYLPVPASGKLTMVSHIPLGHPADKFIVPTIDNGQVFVATADGHLLAYGVPPVFSVYNPVAPFRVADTRPGSGQPLAGQTLGTGSIVNVPVVGVDAVPVNATAAVLNVTATNTSHASFLTAFPTGQSVPVASNLNFTAGQTIANLVTVPLGSGGDVSVYNQQGRTDVVADLEGYFTPDSGGAAGLYNPLGPARISDTRPGSGEPNEGQTLGTGSTLVVNVNGAGGVPASAVSAVVLNVTAVNSSLPSFLTAYADGAGRPTASNLNFTPGTVVPNRVIVPVGSDGMVDIFNQQGRVDVVVDVGGWFTDSTGTTGSRFTALSPTRVADTRAGSGYQLSGSTLTTGSTRSVAIAGLAGVPSGAVAVVANVTVADATASSFLIVYPNTGGRPVASDLNWVAGQVVPNLTITQLGSDGAVAVFNHAGNVDVIVDVFGYWS